MINGLMILAYIVYFGLLSLGRPPGWSMASLWFGGLLGLGLEWVDRLIYVYWLKPNEQLSLYIKHFVREHHYIKAFAVLFSRQREQKQLLTKSVIFIFGWIMVATYIITSTGSLIACGVILGIGVSFITEIFRDWKQKEALKARFYWQIKRTVSDREFNFTIGVLCFIFMLLTLGVMKK